jgi:hypothetical protein
MFNYFTQRLNTLRELRANRARERLCLEQAEMSGSAGTRKAWLTLARGYREASRGVDKDGEQDMLIMPRWLAALANRIARRSSSA